MRLSGNILLAGFFSILITAPLSAQDNDGGKAFLLNGLKSHIENAKEYMDTAIKPLLVDGKFANVKRNLTLIEKNTDHFESALSLIISDVKALQQSNPEYIPPQVNLPVPPTEPLIKSMTAKIAILKKEHKDLTELSMNLTDKIYKGKVNFLGNVLKAGTKMFKNYGMGLPDMPSNVLNAYTTIKGMMDNVAEAKGDANILKKNISFVKKNRLIQNYILNTRMPGLLALQKELKNDIALMEDSHRRLKFIISRFQTDLKLLSDSGKTAKELEQVKAKIEKTKSLTNFKPVKKRAPSSSSAKGRKKIEELRKRVLRQRIRLNERYTASVKRYNAARKNLGSMPRISQIRLRTKTLVQLRETDKKLAKAIDLTSNALSALQAQLPSFVSVCDTAVAEIKEIMTRWIALHKQYPYWVNKPSMRIIASILLKKHQTKAGAQNLESQLARFEEDKEYMEESIKIKTKIYEDALDEFSQLEKEHATAYNNLASAYAAYATDGKNFSLAATELISNFMNLARTGNLKRAVELADQLKGPKITTVKRIINTFAMASIIYQRKKSAISVFYRRVPVSDINNCIDAGYISGKKLSGDFFEKFKKNKTIWNTAMFGNGNLLLKQLDKIEEYKYVERIALIKKLNNAASRDLKKAALAQKRFFSNCAGQEKMIAGYPVEKYKTWVNNSRKAANRGREAFFKAFMRIKKEIGLFRSARHSFMSEENSNLLADLSGSMQKFRDSGTGKKVQAIRKAYSRKPVPTIPAIKIGTVNFSYNEKGRRIYLSKNDMTGRYLEITGKIRDTGLPLANVVLSLNGRRIPVKIRGFEFSYRLLPDQNLLYKLKVQVRDCLGRQKKWWGEPYIFSVDMTEPEIYDVRVAGRDFDDILAGNDIFGEDDIDPLYPRMLKISGKARDNQKLKQVEVSVDRGATWAIANYTKNWEYYFIPRDEEVYHIRVRALDKVGLEGKPAEFRELKIRFNKPGEDPQSSLETRTNVLIFDVNQSLNSWYDFERDRAILADQNHDNMNPYPGTDINISVHYLSALNGAEIIEMGKTSLASVTVAPTSGYISGSGSYYSIDSSSLGMVYVIKTHNGKYAKMRITSAVSNTSFKADIVYQPNGTRILQ